MKYLLFISIGKIIENEEWIRSKLETIFPADILENIIESLDSIYLVDYNINTMSNGFIIQLHLAIEGVLSIPFPGSDLFSFIVGSQNNGFIDFKVSLEISNGITFKIEDISFGVSFSNSIVKSVDETTLEPIDTPYEILLQGDFSISWKDGDFDIDFDLSNSLSLKPFMIGDTGIVLSANDVSLNLKGDNKGISISEGMIYFTKIFTQNADETKDYFHIEINNAIIGEKGISAENISANDIGLQFEIFSAENIISLDSADLRIVDNVPKSVSILGSLKLSFIEEPIDVELSWGEGGIIIRAPGDLDFNLGGSDVRIHTSDFIIDLADTISPQPIINAGLGDSFQGVFITSGYVTLPFLNEEDGTPLQVDFENLGIGNQGFHGLLGVSFPREISNSEFGPNCRTCNILTDAFQAALFSISIGFANNTLSAVEIEGGLRFDFGETPFIIGVGIALDTETDEFRVTLSALSEESEDGLIYIYGLKDETHFGFQEVNFIYSAAGGFDIDITGLDLLIKPGDNPLLKELLPPEGIHPELNEFPLRYDNGSLSIRSGLDVDIVIPLNRVIGPITLQTLAIGLETGTNENAITLGVSFGAAIGPIAASVKNLGLRLPFRTAGNRITILTPQFKFPDGIGLGIDSDMIKGGGYIDRKGTQYSGILELSLSTWGVSALAVIDTEPDFSMICAIFAELNIQIGMGFVLQKVGGLLGIHRTIDHEAIAPKIQSGILDDILFPTDVIKNAAQIIQNYNLSFPSQWNQFLFGPAIQIGYGSPPLISAALAVLFEFPSPYSITIMGKVNAEIPPLAPIIELNLGILGEINLTEEFAGIYGALYDSRILTFTLSGDMGCLFSWGPDSQFLFSIGGFHPRYTPPPNFPPFGAPPLKRLQLALSKYVVCEVYLAITTNTFQAGAKVDAKFKGAGAELSGYLGFDTLIQFSPFYFIVDVGAGFAVKFKGYTLLSVDLSGTLEGPNPYKIKGKASFSILFWDVNVNVNLKFGNKKPESIEKFDPWELMYPALMEGDPWESEFPGWADLAVIIRKEDPALQTTDPPPLIHPIGNLRYYQKAVPINQTLEWVITGEPKNYSKFEFDVDEDQSNGLIKGEVVKELFAPAHWTKMSQTEKLNAPSTDEHDAGIYVTSNEIKFETITHKNVVYETIMIGMPEGSLAGLNFLAVALFIPSLMECNVFEMTSAAYVNNLLNNNHNQYCYDHIPVAATVMEEKFIIIDENFNRVNLNLVDNEELNEEYNHTSATNILKEYKANNPQDERVLQVISLFELEGGML